MTEMNSENTKIRWASSLRGGAGGRGGIQEGNLKAGQIGNSVA